MSNIKQLRGQIRQIVKELLPEILNEQLLQEIEKKIKVRLDAIDKRQKTINSYVVRNHASTEPLLKLNK